MATESYSTDPAVIEQVLNLQSNEEDPQAIQLAQKQAMVNALRKQSMGASQNRGQMAGRVFVGGNTAATVLGDAAQGLAAGKMQSDIDSGQQQLGTQRTSGKKAYMNALLSAMRGGGQQPPPPQPGIAPSQVADGFTTDPQAGY